MTETGSHEVVVNDVDSTRQIRINRPAKKNALTNAMYRVLADAIRTAENDELSSSIVISAEGPLFSAGNDVAEFISEPPLTFDSPVFRFLLALVNTPVPVIVLVSGSAIGIGTTMLLHCDFVYATPDARFAVPFVDIGLVPEAASSMLLPRLLGDARAAELLLLGKPLCAEEAAALGLINAVVGSDVISATVAATAAALAKKPRRALYETKRLLRANRRDIEERMRLEQRAIMERLSSAESQEALALFLRR